MAGRMKQVLSVLVVSVIAAAWVGAQAESHVRIIRLSYVDGSVQMDRPGQGMERAILNTPVTEGFRLVTGNDGLAEVEFENNSSVRLGENSEVHFSKLIVNDAGLKVNELDAVKGTLYIDTRSSKGDIYRVLAGNSTFSVDRDTQLRFSNDNGRVALSVMKGEAQLENQATAVKIKKKETLTLDSDSASGYQIAKGVEAAPLDRWNDERSAYQTAYGTNTYYGYRPMGSSFGYADLGYYGAWSYLPGLGMAWQPYGIDGWMGWNPYMAGAWTFCPGFGYAWASAYPWGWLPYHYGGWTFINGSGWFWTPGVATNGSRWYYSNFQTAPVVRGPAGWRPPTTAPVVNTAATYSPTVKVGMIGSLPASIPGGRDVPNFRSVVPRSNFPVANANATRSPQRATTFTGNSATTRTFVPPQSNAPLEGRSVRAVNNHGSSGHVFAAPPPIPSVSTFGGYEASGTGMRSGSSIGAVSSPRATPGARMGGSGAVHAGGTSHR